MARTGNWGEEPLKRAKKLIEFLINYSHSNNQQKELFTEWKDRYRDSDRPKLFIRTNLRELAGLLNQERPSKYKSGSKTDKRKNEIQDTINYLKELGIVTEDSTPSQKSKGTRALTFALWNSHKMSENLTNLGLVWENQKDQKESKTEKHNSSNQKQQINRELDPILKENIDSYISKLFRKDQFAELDQAGEPETGDKRTNLQKVFIDLFLAPCNEIATETRGKFTVEDDLFINRNYIPAMEYFTQEEKKYNKVVIIGGPGQGKSTLGQQLAQVHRAKHKGKEYEFTENIKIKRIPFRVILKYFAQWLSNKPESSSLENYLATEMGKIIERPGEIFAATIQDIFKKKECLLILDGLDEISDGRLQQQMVEEIYTFLDWAEDIKVDLKVVVTSRPNMYKQQFDPQIFRHLRLLELIPYQVTEYALKWVKTREIDDGEQIRIIDILQECGQDERISKLLTTPLQVTIILLIIKNGGRPPGERETLFNEYWNTILKREKSKDKNLIKSDDQILLNVHSYLGYLLHKYASPNTSDTSNINAQSLLTQDEFRAAIKKVLRENDDYSSKKDINNKIEEFVKDAQDRLVLIVEPQPGLFGFEIRSFQEFFAAVYLFRKGNKFENLKEKIAAVDSEHWRYVCLFLAGRIVRELGDDSEKILTQVCRPLDRPVEDKNHNQNHFLRPGAWFALEVVADGSLSKSQYRNFQYDLIDYGLEVLDTGLTRSQIYQLSYYTKQLSQSDKNDLLRRILESKFNGKNFPESCWENALDIYGKYFPQEDFLKEKVDALLETEEKNLILSAFKLALSYIPDSLWIAKRLENYWLYWIENEDIVIKFLSRDDKNELLRCWSLDKSQSEKLAEVIIENWRNDSHRSEKLSWEFTQPQVLADQLILLPDFLLIIASYCRNKPFKEEIKGNVLHGVQILIKPSKTSYISDIPSETIDSVARLLQNNDFILPVKLILWIVFWLFNQLDKQNIELFGNFLKDNSPLPDYFDRLWSILGFLEYSWCLLTLAIKVNTNQQDKFANFLDYLDGSTQISIAEEIDKVIKEFLDKDNDQEKQRLIIALLTSVGLDDFFPQLTSTARKIGVRLYELVEAYLAFYSLNPDLEYPPEQLQKMLTIVEKAIQNREKPYKNLWLIFIGIWSYSSEVIEYARQILELFLEKYSESYPFPPASLGITLFLKLLKHDANILDLAPNLFTTLPLYKLIEVDRYKPLYNPIEIDIVAIYESFIKPDEKYISRFTPLLTHSNKSVRVGSALIFKAIRDSSNRSIETKRQFFPDIPIDFSLGIEFIHKEKTKDRLIGITLLSFPDYPIEEKQYQHLILNNLQHPKTEAEEKAWNKFLKEIPMDSEKHFMWRTLLEEILRKPAVYSSSVLRIAMERYLELLGKS
ncbi:NACHT domain-containing protein [Okeania sp. SIO1I7]|uniref:NACHT domain-containing protein n=1 Tax=Okeania sp. SIO1I7 TaxID=2607772 RepID=UPI0013FAD3BA|nr:NACHT domain-containing protein [Okeania sp. SIO1I7]NET24344.1 NACHT domain-containing protein [Okeania sp. SIO1I7]